MTKLNMEIGREMTKNLCEECRQKLETVITEKDIKSCLKNPFGYKRLVVKIEDNTCNDCRRKIWARGLQKS